MNLRVRPRVKGVFLWDDRSGSGSVIRDHLDYGTCFEPMNPCPELIHRFILCNVFRVISDHSFSSGSSKRIASLISDTWFARVSPSNLGSETLKKIEPVSNSV